MGFFSLFVLAFGLSMDAFAVAVTNGIVYNREGRGKGALVALAFGLAQGLMPVFGYLAGTLFAEQVVKIDHWIALVLLGAIGGKMLYEGAAGGDDAADVAPRLTFKMLLVQAIATSIDALAVGVGLAAMQVNIVYASAFIAVTTFTLCAIGFVLGGRLGTLVSKRATMLGGVILIGLGLKIFIEHTFSI